MMEYLGIVLAFVIIGVTLLFYFKKAYKNSMRYRIAQDLKNPLKQWLRCAHLMDNQDLKYQELYDTDVQYLRERINELYYVDSREELFSRWEFSGNESNNALDYLMYLYVWELAVGAQYATAEESAAVVQSVVDKMQKQYKSWEEYAEEFKQRRRESWERRGERSVENIRESMQGIEQDIEWTLVNLAPQIAFGTKF